MKIIMRLYIVYISIKNMITHFSLLNVSTYMSIRHCVCRDDISFLKTI